ncbi:MAG: Nif3-like dinuclear metal center hexameric protein [Patescibacteria group bacterium]|jgi:dinuclear metal center YbgI/SA1388 family protein
MNAKTIIDYLEARFPLSLQGPQDTSGLQWGSDRIGVKRVVVSYEKTLDVISYCINTRCDLLITHRPLLLQSKFGPPPEKWWGKITDLLNRSNIAIYSLHDNLDRASHGTGYQLAANLELRVVSQTGEYVVTTMPSTTLSEFAVYVNSRLNPEYIVVAGDPMNIIERVGIVAGSAMSLQDIDFMSDIGVQCYLSGDPDDFAIRYARDLGLCTINCDDYALERPAVLMLFRLLNEYFPLLDIDLYDCRYNMV